MRLLRAPRLRRGQTLVEMALVLPLLLMTLFGITVLGIGVFYQQELANAAREAARYAAIHSATAQCPTVASQVGSPAGAYDPKTPPNTYYRCDRPEDGWPLMTAAGRNAVFGLDRSQVRIVACWSSFHATLIDGSADPAAYDAPPPGTVIVQGSPPVETVWVPCSIGGIQDPETNPSALPCTSSVVTTDTGSDISSDNTSRFMANRVTVYACYQWTPPLAGFLLIPSTVTQRAVVSEPIQRQQ